MIKNDNLVYNLLIFAMIWIASAFRTTDPNGIIENYRIYDFLLEPAIISLIILNISWLGANLLAKDKS